MLTSRAPIRLLLLGALAAVLILSWLVLFPQGATDGSDVPPVVIRTIARDTSIAALSTAALIERLNDEGPGDPRSWWHRTAFLPLDAPARFQQPVPSEARSPVLTELIRRGVDAVPLLLEHLTDSRPTRLVHYRRPVMIGGGTYFHDTYDPRYTGDTFHPPVNGTFDFNTAKPLKAGASYTVKVGDLCYFALGQIVNRQLLVFGSVIEGDRHYVRLGSINSPIEFPALAAAARKDWTGLTREEHQRGLEAEARVNETFGDYSGRCYGAVQRLLFYFPDAGCRVVTDLLQRPLIDQAELGAVTAELARETRERQIDIVTAFRRSHSPEAVDALHRSVAQVCSLPRSDPQFANAQQHLSVALSNCFPTGASDARHPMVGVTLRDQTELVETLEPFAWPELHKTLFALFERARALSAATDGSRFARNQLLLVCASRLKDSPHFETCEAVLKAEIVEVAGTVKSLPERASWRYALETWLHDASALIAKR